MTSTVTHGWLGNNNSDPLSYSLQIIGDLTSISVDMSNDDEKDVQISWTSTYLNALLIHTPFAARLRFNYSTSPQDFDTIAGGVFAWDIASGIPVPVTGDCLNLRITRLNPSDGSSSDDIVEIRMNKDATPGP